MDFRSLTRRELQALCKKNKIPANITNVAMADALQALDLVEGIEDFLKPSESEVAISSVELPQNSDITSQNVPSTGRRTARRKTVKNETETSQSSTRTRNSTRRKLAGNVDDEVVETPAVLTVGRNGAAKEQQDVLKTPGAMLTSQKREAKEKSSVSQVYSIRRSARLAAKRLKESGKQVIESSDQTITFDNFSEAATEGLEVNSGRCSLRFEDELEKAGIELKTASDESLDSKKAKEAATDLSALSFEFENLNLLNKELKVDMPKSSEELATSDNTKAIIENNVDMLLSKKLGEGEEANDDKAKELDSSLDIEPANFILAENSTNNGLSDGKESHCDERLNVPDSYDVEVGLQDPHVLPVTPKSSSGLDQEIVSDGMILPKQLKEPSTEQISVSEVEDADLQYKCTIVSDAMGLSKQLHAPNTNLCMVEDVDLQCKVQEVVVKDDNIKHISDYEVQGSDPQYKGQQLFGDDTVQLDNEDEPNTEEISDLKDDHQCRGQEVVDDEDEINAIEISYPVGEGPLDEFISDEDEAKAEEEGTTQASSETSDGEPSLEEVRGDENGLKAKDSSESSDGELSSEESTGNENEMSYKALYYSEDEDASEAISVNSDAGYTTEAGSESLDSELSLDEFIGDENKPNTGGLSYSEDEDGTDTNSESLDGAHPLEKLTGDEKKPNNDSEDEDATEARSESSGEKETVGEFAGDSAETKLNNEAESKNIESSELLHDASETNMDAIGDQKPVQEYLQNSAGKEPSGLQNVVEAPFEFLESSVPRVDHLIGGTPHSALAFDHKQIPSGSAESNLGHAIQMICSTPAKKSSIKTPKKTPITILSAGLNCVSDGKENVDNSGRKLVRIKKNKKKHHEDCSPRETTKSNANTKEATRPALQQLQEN